MDAARDTDQPETAVDLAAWRALLLAHVAAVRAIEKDVQGAGIPLTWYDVLLELQAAEDGQLRMQELASRVVLSRTRVSRLVDAMAQDGLIVKHPDEQDRRSTWAAITPEGSKALRATAPVYLAGIQRHFNQHLTAAERQAVAEALTKVVDAHAQEGLW